MPDASPAKDTGTRRRGRPPKEAAEPRHPGLPIENPLSTLSPTARNILGTARRLLVERGFEALTIENVALEAGETKASVAHHFGSKAGLVETLFDSLVHNAYVALVASVERVPPGEQRVAAYIGGLRALAEDADAYRAFFQIAPHALRDPVLRPRMAKLYEWYREITLRSCGAVVPGDPAGRRRLLAAASLVLASVDGLALQVALDPDAVAADEAFDILRPAVQRVLTCEEETGQDPRPPGE
jgi:TetR/AcrR family transcriptional regulator, transcriptional repressor of bet genes